MNKYEFDFDKCADELVIMNFNGPSKEWLMFVCDNRKGIKIRVQYDIVIGPVADDNVYAVISRFENGAYDLDETLKRLKVEKLKDQVLLHSEKALRYLNFEGAIEVYGK